LESKSFKPIIKGGKEALNPTKDVTNKTGGRLGLTEIRNASEIASSSWISGLDQD
jgi:hypothetical protein